MIFETLATVYKKGGKENIYPFHITCKIMNILEKQNFT